MENNCYATILSAMTDSHPTVWELREKPPCSTWHANVIMPS